MSREMFMKGHAHQREEHAAATTAHEAQRYAQHSVSDARQLLKNGDQQSRWRRTDDGLRMVATATATVVAETHSC